MANDSSLGGAVNPIVFDLDSQKGVAVLLASVRASAISVEQKNELRDLIFQYTNSGKDPSARISLEQKVNSSGIVPTKSVQKNIVEKLEASPAPIYQFGTSRPSPSFAVSSVPQAAPKPVTPPVPPPAPVNPPPPAPAKPVVEVPPSPPKSEPEKKIPAPEPVSPPPAQAPVAENVPVPTEQPTPVPVSYSKNQEVEPAADPSQGLQRIREIKSQVNEKIGNPVNLVDINNEVGREYMSAMLDAMKKLNTGSSAVSAMKRLEDAFAVVQKTLAEHDRQTESMSSPVEAEGVESVVSASPQPNPIEEVKKTESASNLAPEPESDPWVDRSVEMAMVPEAPKPIPKPASPIPSAPIEQPLTPVKSDWEGAVGEVPTNNLEAHSLAESKVKLKTPSDLPLASSLETSSIAGDPLYTDEIDQGLQQLLEEWPIFKKSGLFGTGPKGREHPLFIKISGLQIPLLLAGRFEGATQEIKQSVTDYMNGWRYEQGIIYEHGEAFEHYLRRVIRHIIDLQK